MNPKRKKPHQTLVSNFSLVLASPSHVVKRLPCTEVPPTPRFSLPSIHLWANSTECSIWAYNFSSPGLGRYVKDQLRRINGAPTLRTRIPPKSVLELCSQCFCTSLLLGSGHLQMGLRLGSLKIHHYGVDPSNENTGFIHSLLHPPSDFLASEGFWREMVSPNLLLPVAMQKTKSRDLKHDWTDLNVGKAKQIKSLSRYTAQFEGVYK
jgi:hypothetical protein